LERRVAEALDGLLHPGQAGDVLVLGRDGETWILEVKYRKGYLLDRKDQLGRWIEQAKGNALRRGRGEKWALVLYGGRGTDLLFLCPLAWVQELFVGLSGLKEIVSEKEENDEFVRDASSILSGGAGLEPERAGSEGWSDLFGDLSTRVGESVPQAEDGRESGQGFGTQS
jgi:hypothetical protein